MKTQNLATYLNDHLAGSVTALELMDHLITIAPELEVFLKHLHAEIQKDQQTLEELMERLGIAQSKLKLGTAWLMEKMGIIKLHLGSDTSLGLLQSLEFLVLGIKGKKALWQALSAISDTVPELKEVDFSTLEMRAVQQSDSVEEKRVEAARRALLK